MNILEKHPSEAGYNKLEKYLLDVIEQFRNLMPLGFPLFGIKSMAPEFNVPDKWLNGTQIANGSIAPQSIPWVNAKVGVNWTASDIAVYGLDEFEILDLHVDPGNKNFLEIYIAINDIRVHTVILEYFNIKE